MSNVFLEKGHDELETAILLENAVQMDLSMISPEYANAVAFTDGKKVFVNSDDNLDKILPDYNHGMLKWLLWHEEYHKQLKHHNRFFKYLDELRDADCYDEFRLTKSEVNIIMDILVHDSLCKMFPELIETAVNNLAQIRNRNSLGYTFKTHTLEEMLDEYAKFKHPEDDEGAGKGESDKEETETEEETEEGDGMGTPKKSKRKPKDEGKKEDSKSKDDDSKGTEKGHAEGGSTGDSPSGEDEKSEETADKTPSEPKEPELPDEHDKTDWSKLEDRDDTEFIDSRDSDRIMKRIDELKKKKFKLASLTKKLNGMVTTEKIRTYSRPSYVGVDKGIMLKGRKYAKTSLYLCFDASGSMGSELALFKEIISKAIPQAMSVPTEWFSGFGEHVPSNPEGRSYDYYKGTFQDIMPVHADSGYSDDGDRTIELCYLAEQKGYSPIGVTDGGGKIDWSKDMLKQLKRTVLVCPEHDDWWAKKAQEINPRIQIMIV